MAHYSFLIFYKTLTYILRNQGNLDESVTGYQSFNALSIFRINLYY